MGIINKPHFDFKDLSASSYDIIYHYLRDANEDVPIDIRDAILDTYNDLRYAIQFGESGASPGRAATPSTSSEDSFVADCVPGPLVNIKEPVQFNVSRPESVSSRCSATSELRSLRVHSAGSRRSLGGKSPSGLKRSDSVIDTDSPLSPKRLSTASNSSLRWSSATSPLRYSFSAIDIEGDPPVSPTNLQEPPIRSGSVDLRMQMDGAADNCGPARRQQYPTWLTAKEVTITPIKRPMLAQRHNRKELGMQMDGASDKDDLSKVIQRQLADFDIEQSVASVYAMDHEDEVSQHDHQINHLERQQDGVEQNLWSQRGFPRPQSPAPSAYATTIFTEAESVYDDHEDRPFRRGRDNLSYYEPDVAAPDPNETSSLPAFLPSAFAAKEESSKYLQDGSSAQAVPIRSSSRSDDGKIEVARHWDWEITAHQKADQEASQNAFEMQILRQNHFASDFGRRAEFHDDTRSLYEPPPPSPTLIDEPRQGDFTTRLEQAIRRGAPMLPPFSPAHNSSHNGHVSSLLYSPEYDDDRTPISPRPWIGRSETRWSQMPTVVNSEYLGGRYSLDRDRSGTVLSSTIVNSRPQPDHSSAGLVPQARSADLARRDSSHGLKYNDRLPKIKISKLNRFLVRLLGEPTFDESVELWNKIQERLDSGELNWVDVDSAFEDGKPTSKLGRLRESAIGSIKRRPRSTNTTI
ncbi:hypothetical protein EG327_001595 [Venturia inaequalis]|uniref:Uncharacterized protein n=1 Tax=Venturia inaequalis TaxID=5025 RepID=A0A8H3ZFK4_VENIN|nr:hypothetical protein EG327_001595 [Venturia inaequalis]